MPNFAIIDSGTVVNVIVADTKEDAELNSGKTAVQISKEPGQPCAGWLYDGENFSFPELEA
jgi:hypothetical protein